jgi:ATP-dependent protease Clp ATPase subunit
MMNKKLLFRYYWENLKTEIARLLLFDKKNAELAQKISRDIFGLTEAKRELCCTVYTQYRRLTYIIEYMDWRQAKCLQTGQIFKFDWNQQRLLIIE